MIDVLLVALSSSYLTLGVAASHAAQALWVPYTILVIILAVISMLGSRRGRRR